MSLTEILDCKGKQKRIKIRLCFCNNKSFCSLQASMLQLSLVTGRGPVC